MAKSEQFNANMAMPFGQYRGVKLVELPKSYLHWLAFKADVAGQLQRSAVAALEYRSALEVAQVTARSPVHHGPYRGTPMIDVPASELHYWIHHHRSTPADVAGASMALMEQTGAKLRETFGSTLAERVGGFPRHRAGQHMTPIYRASIRTAIYRPSIWTSVGVVSSKNARFSAATRSK